MMAYAVCPAKPVVLCLKILQPLHLLGLEPSELLAPAIVRNLAHADLADCIGNAPVLRDQDINLSQLRDNLLSLVPLPRHLGPPSCQKTHLKSDHFNEGGSGTGQFDRRGHFNEV
jgi:hypothetical protein